MPATTPADYEAYSMSTKHSTADAHSENAGMSHLLLALAVQLISYLLAMREMTHLSHRCGYGYTTLPEKKREKSTQTVAQGSVHASPVAAVFEIRMHIRCASLMLLKCRLLACARHISTIFAVA